MDDKPLTRSAALTDYTACASVADWQQTLVTDAHMRWSDNGGRSEGLTICFNWGAARFRGPAADTIYRSHGDPVPRVNDPLACVYALSVLDRIDAPLRFLRAYAEQLLPDGLLVCTFALWDADGQDCAMGAELRQRIYNRDSWKKLAIEARRLGLEPFGGVDMHYRGHTLGDHTLGTLVLTRAGDPPNRRRR